MICEPLLPIVPFAESSELPLPSAFTTEMLDKTGILGQFGVVASLLLAFSFAGGCRGSAYRDVYQQKMASEVRILEDQLYEADYQNQVLQDQVMRAEVKAAQVVVPDSRPRRTLFGKTLNESGEVIDAPGKASNSLLPSEPEPAKNLPPPMLPARPLDGQNQNRLKSNLLSPLANPKSNGNLTPPKEPVPPSEPVPPGAADLLVPDVQLGEPVPPPQSDALPDSLPDSPPNLVPEALPGQIKLPDSAKILGSGTPLEPVAIRINLGLSGGHKAENSQALEGINLFVEAIDEKGTVVSLDQFDIDANLTVVLLDPTQPSSTARLGKWEFGPDEIREMLRPGIALGKSGAGINIVIPWEKQRPESTTVIAHVRLSAGDVAMQTQAEIATAEPAMAQWTPRATRIR